jgi:hypothetical protein
MTFSCALTSDKKLNKEKNSHLNDKGIALLGLKG